MPLKYFCFVWLQKLVRVNQSMDDAKYRTILEENLLEAEINLGGGLPSNMTTTTSI